jgi:hypothetical protein
MIGYRTHPTYGTEQGCTVAKIWCFWVILPTKQEKEKGIKERYHITDVSLRNAKDDTH